MKTICHDVYQNAQKKGFGMKKLFVYSNKEIISLCLLQNYICTRFIQVLSIYTDQM